MLANPKIAFVGRPSEVAIDSGRAKNARYAREFPSIRNSSRGVSPLAPAMARRLVGRRWSRGPASGPATAMLRARLLVRGRALDALPPRALTRLAKPATPRADPSQPEVPTHDRDA